MLGWIDVWVTTESTLLLQLRWTVGAFTFMQENHISSLVWLHRMHMDAVAWLKRPGELRMKSDLHPQIAQLWISFREWKLECCSTSVPLKNYISFFLLRKPGRWLDFDFIKCIHTRPPNTVSWINGFLIMKCWFLCGKQMETALGESDNIAADHGRLS